MAAKDGKHLRNPFGLRGGVDPEHFVIPERLVWEITEDILKKQSVSLIGARMMGKTSLLKFIASKRCQPYYQDGNEQQETPPDTIRREIMQNLNTQRLNQKISDLQQQWELLSKKLQKLERDKILTDKTEEKFRLEQLIDETTDERQRIEQQLNPLETQLSQETPQEEELAAPIRFAYLDLQEHSGKQLTQLLPLLACTMSVSLPVNKQFQGTTHEEALAWIKQTSGRRGTPGLLWVLCLDEFDRVVELDGLDKAIFDQMRSLPQHSNLCFVIASRLKLIDLPLPQSVSTSPFFNIFKEHFLSVWDEPTTQTLMFKPYGKELGVFTEEDFAFISRLTARHPALLQIGCCHLFNARRACKDTPIDYEQVTENYIHEAESVYRHYWNNEIAEEQREWLRDCRRALTGKDYAALQALKNNSSARKNRTIRLQLAKLGFVLNTSGTIELPTGFQLFLETV